jgi:hypothetical protein
MKMRILTRRCVTMRVAEREDTSSQVVVEYF